MREKLNRLQGYIGRLALCNVVTFVTIFSSYGQGAPNTRAAILSPSLDADAMAWKTNVIANGGSVSTSTIKAVSDFAKGCKSDGTWVKLLDVGIFAGDQLAAALTKLKTLSASSSYTNNNFVSGDYAQATGLTGNGSSKYLGTGFNASALTTNSTHLAVYDRANFNATSNATGAIGTPSDTQGFVLYYAYTNLHSYSNQYDIVGEIDSGALSGPVGMIIASRNSSSSHAIYRAGVAVASGTTTTGALPAVEVFVIAINNNGTPGNYGTHAVSFVSYGSGLSVTDVTSLSARVNTLQTALGRNVY